MPFHDVYRSMEIKLTPVAAYVFSDAFTETEKPSVEQHGFQ